MDGINGALLFQIPVFFTAVGIVALYAWYRSGAALPPQARALRNGRRRLRLPWAAALIGVWFLLSVVSAWIVFLIGGFVSHVLLFWFGSAAAAMGLDGAVVGSAIINVIEQSDTHQQADEVRQYVEVLTGHRRADVRQRDGMG